MVEEILDVDCEESQRSYSEALKALWHSRMSEAYADVVPHDEMTAMSRCSLPEQPTHQLSASHNASLLSNYTAYTLHHSISPSLTTHLMLNGPGLSGTSPSQGRCMLRFGVTLASHRPRGSVTRMTKYDEKEGELDL